MPTDRPKDKQQACDSGESHVAEQPMHAGLVAELFGSWRIKKRPGFQYQLTFSGSINCTSDMADGDFTLGGLKDHGTRMGGDEANIGAGLPYCVCAVTNMHNIVGADTTVIQPHSKELADSAGREVAFSATMTAKLDVFPSKREKDSGNGDDDEPTEDGSQC